jgi:hypothetical protein
MADFFSGMHLIFWLPFLLSSAAWCGAPKMLCLIARIVVLAVSVENAAMLDWMIGTAVAGIPVRERIQQCRLALSTSLRASPDGSALRAAR